MPDKRNRDKAPDAWFALQQRTMYSTGRLPFASANTVQIRFYNTSSGREVVLEFIRGLSPADRRVIGEDLKTVELKFPIGPPLCKNVGNGLWEVRSSLPSKREARLIFFHASAQGALVVVHAFIKKSRKTPDEDLKLASARRREFEALE